nr:hypothetical protein [Tanacetum cinerariifolium]
MSNINNTMQTQTSNALHNAIMEAGGKDRPPMLAPGNYVQWKSRIKRYINIKPNHELIYYCLKNPPYKYTWADKDVPLTEGSSETTTERYMEKYKNVSQDIRDQLNAEAEVIQIILTGIDNDIYSTFDACPNACEMWKAIERLKQGESINVQDLETNLYWEFGKFTSQDGKSLELYYSRFYKMMNELVRNQCDVTNHQVNVRSQQAATRNRGKAIINSPPPIYDQEPYVVAEDDEIANQDNSPRINRGTGYDNQRIVNVVGARENVGTKVVQQSGIQCYNCMEFGHVERECQKPKRAKDAAYHKEKMLLCKQEETEFQLNAEQADWRDDTDDEPDDQELEAHYMYMAKLQEVTLDDADNSGPIFDTEPLQKVSNNDNYNVFSIECEHPEQSKSVNDTYPIEQDEHNVIIDSVDMSYDRGQVDQDDEADLANERDLLASLIEKLKCEIDDNKNRNKFLETSNKALVDKLKEMKKDLFACQETISILSQQQEAQIKLYKTREDKEIDKVIALENKVKVLDNIVYKTGQSVQTMNMLNSKCKTSFAKPEFLKKAQRANPRLCDIGCYNDNLALMLAPESDDVIHLEKESRSKLSDLIRPFDYEKLNNLYDLFLPQREKSSAQRYFSERRINVDLKQFHLCLKEEMVAYLRYFNALELEVDYLRSQLKTQKMQFLNEIDRLSREYYYVDHMNVILGVYTELDEVTNLQCDYLETLEKCECLEKELSKSKIMSKSFETFQKHAINLELELQQCKEKIKNEKLFKENQSKEFHKEREQYFEIQDLKAQLQDKGIAISELKKLIEKLKGKFVDTKFEKSSIIRQSNAFKSQIPSILGKPAIFSVSLEKKDCSKSKSVTKNNVSNDFSKPVTAQILPPNKRVIPITSVSRTQLKCNQLEDRVMFNNSQGKKQEVEDHCRNVIFSNNKTFVTVCNDSLNAKTSDVNFVCVACGKCVLNVNHEKCVLHYLNGVNSRIKMPMAVPISTREPKRIINQSVAKPLKRTIASESTNQKHRHTSRKLYEHVSKACSWWYPKFTPPGYKWKHKSRIGNANPNLVEIIIFIVDSGCSKHMTGNLKLLTSFMEKFLGQGSRDCVGISEDGERCLPSGFLSAIVVKKEEEKEEKSLGGKKVIQCKCTVVQNVTGVNVCEIYIFSPS